MTIPEAVQLVLHAADVAETRDGDRDQGVFVLEMGEPVKIIDMARRMIELLAPPGLQMPIEIKLIGLQPGEKLSEELVDSNEETIYSAEGVLEVRSRKPAPLSLKDAEALARFAISNDADAVRGRLFEEVARIRGVAPTPPPVRLQLLRGDRSA
jgi:O-antigen biosynthesis protein WbqV